MRKTVPIASLTFPFYVRQAQDEDRVLHMMELIQTKHPLPRPEVTESLEVIDGRHRIAACVRLGLTEIEVTVVPDAPRADLILRAWAANEGGALPSSQGDKMHTLTLLMSSGLSRPRLVRLVEAQIGLPRQYIGNLMDKIQTNLAKARAERARADVLNNDLSIKDAALKHDVKIETLRTLVSGKSAKAAKDKLGTFKGNLKQSLDKASQSVGAQLKNCFTLMENGELTSLEVEALLEYTAHQTRRMVKNQENWLDRVKAYRASTE